MSYSAIVKEILFLAIQPSPDWKGGAAVANSQRSFERAMEAKAGTLQSGVARKASEWRSLPNSKTKKYAPKRKKSKTQAFSCNLPSLQLFCKLL